MSGARKGRRGLRATVIGTWSVELDGRSTRLGENQRPALQALILAGSSGVSTEELSLLMRDPLRDRHLREGSMRQALTDLRDRGLDIKTDNGRVVLPRKQKVLKVDLWEFQERVLLEDLWGAGAMVAPGDKLDVPRPWLDLLEEYTPLFWADTEAEFEQDKQRAIEVTRAETVATEAMMEMRRKLLRRPLIYGFDPPTRIEDLRPRLDAIHFPWHDRRSADDPTDRLLPEYLTEELSRDKGTPSQVVLIGSPGAGKALTAVSVYLRLTDALERGETRIRSVLFVNARTETNKDEDFATDRWFAKRLADAGIPEYERPIVIMTHADAYFSAKVAEDASNLEEVLTQKIFRDCDLLLCCNEQFHLKALAWQEYGTDEIKLEPWGPETQRDFVMALYEDDKTLERFEAWRDEYPSRLILCEVPLHLNFVLSLFNKGEDAVKNIEQRWQLFEQVAKMRLAATRHKLEEQGFMEDLGALAHEFYAAGSPSDPPISFSEEQLRENLARRGVEADASRVESLIEHTVLAVDELGLIRFSDLSWGWFFVAYHLCRTLAKAPPHPEVLDSFDKLFSVSVMDRCEEILLSWPVQRRAVVSSLQSALAAGTKGSFIPVRWRIAREQIGYLLGVVADPDLQAELEGMLKAGESLEGDDLVRRGISVGLANKGAKHIADAYVETLRDELREGRSSQADTNIGAVLSFRGDQPFDPNHPGAIVGTPDPARTVAELTAGLGKTRHEGTWRIKLFTLFDLATRVAPERFAQHVAAHREHLLSLLDDLDAKATVAHWPEIAELRAVLEDLSARRSR